MRPRLIEVDHILLEHSTEVRFARNEDVIEAFTAHAPQPSLTDGIRTWCLDRYAKHLNPASNRNSIDV